MQKTTTKKNAKPAAAATQVTTPAADATTVKATKTTVTGDGTPLVVTVDDAKQLAKKSKADAKATDTSASAAKPVQSVDAFGSVIGSKAAVVNAALSKEPQKMKRLMEAAGVDCTFYNHLNRLVAAGKVVKTADGYRLP